MLEVWLDKVPALLKELAILQEMLRLLVGLLAMGVLAVMPELLLLHLTQERRRLEVMVAPEELALSLMPED